MRKSDHADCFDTTSRTQGVNGNDRKQLERPDPSATRTDRGTGPLKEGNGLVRPMRREAIPLSITARCGHRLSPYQADPLDPMFPAVSGHMLCSGCLLKPSSASMCGICVRGWISNHAI